MTRRRTRRRTENGSGLLGWSLAGAIGILTFTGLGYAAFATSKAARFGEDLCNVNGPSAVTVVLVDATDSISPLQQTAISNRLDRISRELVANERLAVFEISPDRAQLEPILSICRPVTAAETSEVTGNKKIAAQKFDQNFKPKVAAALNRLLARKAADQSPIMEGVQAASVAAFQATDLPDDAPKRLIVVSDMLQHGPAGSHYRGLPDFESYRTSPSFARATSDLSGVDVVLLYLRRDNANGVQGMNHIEFWTRWFAAQGAEDFKAIPIEG